MYAYLYYELYTYIGARARALARVFLCTFIGLPSRGGRPTGLTTSSDFLMDDGRGGFDVERVRTLESMYRGSRYLEEASRVTTNEDRRWCDRRDRTMTP